MSETLKLRRNLLLDAGWLTNLQQFQGARPDHVRVESSSCCFPKELVSFVRPRELVSFVRPRELVSFDPRHVTRSPPIGKRI